MELKIQDGRMPACKLKKPCGRGSARGSLLPLENLPRALQAVAAERYTVVE